METEPSEQVPEDVQAQIDAERARLLAEREALPEIDIEEANDNDEHAAAYTEFLATLTDPVVRVELSDGTFYDFLPLDLTAHQSRTARANGVDANQLFGEIASTLQLGRRLGLGDTLDIETVERIVQCSRLQETDSWQPEIGLRQRDITSVSIVERTADPN